MYIPTMEFLLSCGQMPLEIPHARHQITTDSLNLFAWDSACNYGDYLGPLLFQAITQMDVHIEARKLYPVIDAGESRVIYCFLGTMAQLLKGESKFVIFGMGVSGAGVDTNHGDRELATDLDLLVIALRGHLTLMEFQRAGYTIDFDVALGDPALLLPGIFDLTNSLNTNPNNINRPRLGLVPHHNRVEEYKIKFPDFKIINPATCNLRSLNRLIENIQVLDAVITSSLHIAILCETLGKPVRILEPKNRFKFDDFYSAIGKKTPYILESSLFQGNYVDFNWTSFDWDADFYMSRFPFNVESCFAERVSNHYKSISIRNPISFKVELKSEYFEEFESDFVHRVDLEDYNLLGCFNERDLISAEDSEHGFRSYSYTEWIDVSGIEKVIIKIENGNTGVRIWLQSFAFETWETKDCARETTVYMTLLPQLLMDKFRIVVFSNSNWNAFITLYGN